jgi:hypothetical protein
MAGTGAGADADAPRMQEQVEPALLNALQEDARLPVRPRPGPGEEGESAPDGGARGSGSGSARRSSRPRSAPASAAAPHEGGPAAVLVAGPEAPALAALVRVAPAPAAPAQAAPTARPIRPVVSERTKRRWANERRAGAELSGRLSPDPEATPAPFYDASLDDFDVAAASRLIFEQEYTSCFDGFTEELRRDFLRCENGFERLGLGPARPESQRAAPPEDTAERRFARVDRNLQHHLLETGVRAPFAAFVQQLEALLLGALLRDEDAPTVGSSSIFAVSATEAPELARALARPPTRVSTAGRGPAIGLCFHGGVHRLLAHGTCQFHGLSSASENEPSGARVMLVTNPRKGRLASQGQDMARAPGHAPGSLPIGGGPGPLVPYLILHKALAVKA